MKKVQYEITYGRHYAQNAEGKHVLMSKGDKFTHDLLNEDLCLSKTSQHRFKRVGDNSGQKASTKKA